MPAADLGLGGLIDLLRQSGPAGAILAGVIVGLTLAVIVLARFGNIWATVRDRSQAVDFQARLLKTIETLQASEEALRRRLDEVSRDRGLLKDEVDDFRVQLALLRNQRRRLIEMLRHAVARLPEPAIVAAPALPARGGRA